MTNIIDFSERLKDKKNEVNMKRLNELMNEAIKSGLAEEKQKEVAELYNQYKEKLQENVKKNNLDIAVNTADGVLKGLGYSVDKETIKRLVEEAELNMFSDD